MNLQLYFDPVDFGIYQKKRKFTKHSLGYYIEKESLGETSVARCTIALAGVPDDRGTPSKGTAKAPDEIRKYLYSLSNHDASIRIVDLGNLKPGKSSQDLHFALRDVVDYLKEAGIITIILGGGQDLSIGAAKAFHGLKEFTLGIADCRVDIKTGRETTDSTNFISKILRENPALFHLEMLGIQQHFVAPSVLEFLRGKTFDCLQLGQIRDDIHVLEPILRNIHFLSFDISAVKQQEAGAQQPPNPNGFYSEEACLIARYAGLSNRLWVFGIFELNPSLEKNGLSAALAAQMIWYFIEGASHRRKEDPAIAKNAFTRYYVEMEDHGEAMVFYHHPVTNRWWIEIFPEEGESWIIACREADYQKAILKEIPEIYWKYVRKTARLSK